MAKATTTRPQRTIPPLRVRYPRRMRPQRTYAVQVSWQSREKPKAATRPYTVRLVMAGAQVVPSERTMDPARPTERAVFYVTPLARRGWLKGERLEVLANGEKVQEIALPAKVTTQRTTWILLLLTFLVPWFLLAHVQLTEGEYDMVVKQGGPWKQLVRGLEHNTPLLTEEVKETLTEGVQTIGLRPETIPNAYNWLYRLVTRDQLFTEDEVYQAHLPFFVGVVLLIFTLLSWFCHREKKKTRTGQPLPLPGEV